MDGVNKKDLDSEFSRSQYDINWEQFACLLCRVLEKMFDILIILRKDGTITHISGKTARLLEYDKPEMIGKNLFDIVEDKERMFKIFENGILSQVSNIELNIKKKEGSIGNFIASVYESSCASDSKDSNFVFIIGREVEKITECETNYSYSASEKTVFKKYAVDDFEFMDEKSKERILQSAKISAMGILASSVAHEINTPLSGVLGYVELLINKIESRNMLIDEDYLLDKLEIIRECGNKCKTIAEKFLEFSRKSAGNFNIVDINNIVEDSVTVTKSKIRYVAKIHKNLAKDSLLVYGNSNELQQVIVNLILNAGDAIEKKGNIWIKTEMDDERNIRIYVKDDGIGMNEYVLKHIFRPFFTTKPPGRGTGLGLSVCNGIIKKHNGKIDVVSKEGEGTEFIITLPYYKKIDEQNTISKEEGERREGDEI